MADGVERLRDLGVSIPAERSATIRGIRFIDGRRVAEGVFRDRPAAGIRRIDLHRALSRRAGEVGVGLGWGIRATGIADDVVDTDGGAIRSRWIVAADGRASRIRAWSGLEGGGSRRGRIGIRRHYGISPWSGCVEVYWSDGAEAYVTPVGPSTVGVALLTGDTRPDIDRALDRWPVLQSRLAGAPVVSRDRGATGFGSTPSAVVRDRIALVGDASGSLDPITGEGLAVAFHQAFAVVDAIVRGDLARYEGEHRRIMRTPRLFARGLLLAAARPAIRRVMMRCLAARPALFDGLLKLKTRPVRGSRTAVAVAGRTARPGA
jgi:flavin-dependent dehydrogenase